MMKVTNYKSNQTLIETTDYTAHLSYGVPQVVVFIVVLHLKILLCIIAHFIQILHQSIKMHICEPCVPIHTHSFLRHLKRFRKLLTYKLHNLYKEINNVITCYHLYY